MENSQQSSEVAVDFSEVSNALSLAISENPSDLMLLFFGIIAFFGCFFLLTKRGFKKEKFSIFRPNILLKKQQAPKLDCLSEDENLNEEIGAENIASRSKYMSKRVMGGKEVSLYQSINQLLKREHFNGYALMKVNLRSFLKSINSEFGANKAIQGESVDILICDANFNPLLAIDYVGGLNSLKTLYTDNTAKKVALRKAKIEYTQMDVFDSDLITKVIRQSQLVK